MRDFLEQTGQLAATNSVNLVARVQGYLTAIGYQDGDIVAKRTNLFTIEPGPYKAQLAQAQANLASAQAKALYSGHVYERYSALAKSDTASRDQEQQSLSNRDAANAEVAQAQAAVDQAAITFAYTEVSAPFDGIVTAHLANIGSLVGGSPATQLATIIQIDPIWVNFNISEQDVLRLRAIRKALGKTFAELRDTPIEIGLEGEAGYPHEGHLDYVTPLVDPGTGTLAVRGVFSNPDRLLLPGYFVRIRIPIGPPRNALLIPESALGSDQGGRTLEVVGANDVVEQRNVTVGGREGSSRVVLSGLKPEDRVIVIGQQRAQIGGRVIPREAESAMTRDEGDLP